MTHPTVFPQPLGQWIVLVLGFGLTLSSSPVPVEGSAQNGLIGSLSAAGSVWLRGVEVSRAGTLFSGDRIRTSEDAYARLTLTEGHRIELGGGTDVTVEGGIDGSETASGSARLDVRAGRILFASSPASEPLSVKVESFRIVAGSGSSGEVSFLERNEVGVRVDTGRLMVRNNSTGESWTIEAEQNGQDEGQVITLDEPLDTGAQTESSEEGGVPATAIYALAGGGTAGLVLYLAMRDSASPN
jgi:ferric-dicitrate binding protein FerR (iron transport regulator)